MTDDAVTEDVAAGMLAAEALTKVAITRALVSVHDKTGLAELAAGLHAAGVEIVSTGSTAAVITGAGLPVVPVEELTGFPECLDGRVKTLHPRVHAGLLADIRDARQRGELHELGIAAFELLVVNLYPFRATVASGAAAEECIEQIDIGGPAMIRAAAKNHASVAVVTEPSSYPDVLAAASHGGFTGDERRALAARAFAHTAGYDAAVASWFAGSYAPDEVARESGWPEVAGGLWSRSTVLRYGENPHQRAALYVREQVPAGAAATSAEGTGGAGSTATAAPSGVGMAGSGIASPGIAGPGIAGAVQLHGKAMSYNNYVDSDAARRAAYDFAQPCVAVCKHANPCGIAVGADLAEAHAKAHACDPTSAFGGVVAANGPVTAALARQVATVFTEVVIAPDFNADALEILTAKKNLRLLRCPAPSGAPGGTAQGGPGVGAAQASANHRPPDIEWRPVSGGMLAQTVDRVDAPGDDPATWELKAGPAADADTLADLAFGWRAARAVKSNAILLAAGGASVGIGMGQVSRVDASKIAVARAGERAAGSVAASDAFFPFPDALEVLTAAGVRAVVEPGGSVRDELAVEAAEKAGVSLYFTGVRHFYH